MRSLAPIILFVYNRPDETRRTLDALRKNDLAEQSELIIFSDAPKNSNEVSRVNDVRTLISNISGFKQVTIIEQRYNKGLANSIINGVNEIIKAQNKVIVLEDDLITSRLFLTYMNNCLDFYEENKTIWSISGFTPNLAIPPDYKHDIYLTMRACSWGWATWKDRWINIDWNINNYHQVSQKKYRSKINRCGNDMRWMLSDQKKGYINSWAVRWCYNQLIKEMYTVYPTSSFICNIGMIGEGTHGSFRKEYVTNNINESIPHIENITEDERVVMSFAKCYDMKMYNYVGVILKRIGLYKKVKLIIKSMIYR
ncbi:sugar transferase [Paenibacillus selenitireducens]|uniref:Sugar transferase n=1 Tax=Paenibacillus selenitireducens TaxID=1324314 RepID=A0A1T2XKW7_9BACL|nr:glycosyltransferase [Paenibacillus selenitireducens]OPA80472.1 sugar transferase [Paenibacillus selenitireducens]